MNPPDKAIVLSFDKKTPILALTVHSRCCNSSRGQVERSLDPHVISTTAASTEPLRLTPWLEKHPRIKLQFTATSASWHNAVEGWFAQLERQALYRGVFISVKQLKDEIHRFKKVHNAVSAKPFKWTKERKSHN